MKKISVTILLLSLTRFGLAQTSLTFKMGALGPRFCYLKEATDIYSNDKKNTFSPELNVQLKLKKFIISVGISYCDQRFSLQPGNYWLKPYDSLVGPLSYNKRVAYQETHLLLGRSFGFENTSLQLNLQGGAFLLNQVKGKESFVGPYPFNYTPGWGAYPSEKLFNPLIPGLMAELECNYRLKTRWSVYASLSWRGLLNYVTVDELGGPKDHIPIPRLKRNYINLGLGIGYTFIQSKAK